MVRLDEECTQYVLNHCPKRTDDALMQRFGISYNTLRKIEARSPLRPSLATRLHDRIHREREDGSAKAAVSS
jgi:hypothetical protein